MRALLVALLVTASLAGCTSEEEGPALAAVQTAKLSGTVTTIALEPLADARVLVPDSPYETRTDTTGRFEFVLPLGEYVVITDLADYINAAQRARLDGPDVSLAFQLKPKPTEAPGQRTYEAHGLYSCGATVKTGDSHGDDSSQTFDCGSSDPNARESLDFFLEPEPGISGLVIELSWEPVSDAGRAFHLHAFQMNGETPEEIGETEGLGYARIVVPETAAQIRFSEGGTLRATAVPAGSFLDEESPADVGLVFQQPFAVYVTVFTNAPPPPAFSVIGGPATP